MSSQAMEKVAYLAQQTWRRLFAAPATCPNCGGEDYETIDAKAVVTELRECGCCRMQYRFPTDSTEDNRQYYQKAYKQGFTTDLPADATLARLKETHFAAHEKSYAALIELLGRLGVAPGAHIFDYGCSWGFGSWQLAEAGFAVSAFEISRDRAAYARGKLGVDCANDLELIAANDALRGSFDVFFSNHVMEHVPSPSKAVGLARVLVRPRGLFFATTPNGSLGFRAVAPQAWRQFWGKVHPNLLSDTFWAAEFAHNDYFIGALPSCVDEAEAWASSGGQVMAAQRDAELLCVARL